MDYEDRQEALLRTFGTVHAFDSDSHLFVVSPDRIGFGVECQPLSGMDAASFDSLNAALNVDFPTDTIVQFSLYASPDIESSLADFEAMRADAKEPIFKELTRRRSEFLRELTARPIGQTAGARLRNMRLLITVQIPHGNKPPNEKQSAAIRSLIQQFEAALKATGLRYEKLTAAKYLRFMQAVFNQGPKAFWRDSPWTAAEDDYLLCNQILDPDTAIDVKADRLKFGDHTEVRVMSVKRYPDTFFPGMGARFMGDVARGAKAIKDPVLFTVNIIYPDHEAKRGKLTRDFAWAQKQSEGRLARYVPAIGRKAESLRIANASVEAGDRIVYAYIACATFSNDESDAIHASTELRSMFRELGFQMMEDKYMLLPMFAQLLPFGAEVDIRKSLTRYRTMATRHAAAMLPVLGTWRGTGTPLMTLFSRDGQLMTFSPYNSDGNFNMIIAAQSGMGKSYFANNMATNFLTIGGRVWIIDRGYSYKKLCDMLDGQYVEFSDESKLCLNPFPLVSNFRDEVSILANIVTVMAAPKFGLNDLETPELIRVMTECWERKGGEMDIDYLAAALLEEEDSAISNLGRQLFPFTTKGQFGSYFNGPNTIDMDNRLVCLELQQLGGRPHLQRVVLLQLMYQIQQGMDESPRDIAKLLLIDEAWSLLASKETQEFIISWYRQLRKFGACAAVCTQSVNDFYLDEGSMAIVENSAHMLLLGQKAESIAKVKKEGRLSMSEWDFKMLASVHTMQGEYSEIFIRNAFGSGIGRLVESPFNNLLYSSHADDVTAIEHYRHQGYSQVDSINSVLRDRGLVSPDDIREQGDLAPTAPPNARTVSKAEEVA